MCEYGCALIITKQLQESPISVSIIFPQEWSSGSNTYKNQKLYFCQPKGVASIYTSQLAYNDRSIDTFITNFQASISDQLNNKKQAKKKDKKINQPFQKQQEIESEIKQLSEKTIKSGIEQENDEGSNESELEQEQKQGKPKKKIFNIKQVEKAVKQSIISNKKQNQKDEQEEEEQSAEQQKTQQKVKTNIDMNIDFNQCTANTSWYVLESIIKKSTINRRGPLESRIKCDKLIIGFKVQILRKVLEQLSTDQEYQPKRQDIIKFKKCLNQAIYAYRSIISSHSKKNQKFLEDINQINTAIYQLNGGSFTTQIYENDDEEQENIQVDFNCTPLITKPAKNIKTTQSSGLTTIYQFCYDVSHKYPFQTLLNMHNQQMQKLKLEKNQQKKQSFLNHWVLLVEKTVFQLAHQIFQWDKKQKQIDLDIHLRQIQCDFGASSICKLVLQYEKIINQNQAHYGMGLKAQAFSHIQLVKTICSVIAFECVRVKRKNMKSNIDKYLVPLDISNLFRFFISHDYLARRAMKCMNQYYLKRHKKNYQPIFKLDKSCRSFIEFSKAVVQQSRKAQAWLTYMKQLALYSNVKTIFPADGESQQLIAFLHNIPSDVLGLIKMVMLAQNPKIKMSQKQLTQNGFIILNTIPMIQKQQLRLQIYGKKNLRQFLALQKLQGLKLLFNGCQSGSQFTLAQFQCYNNSLKAGLDSNKDNQIVKKYQIFLRPPCDKKMSRQHEAYSSKILLPQNMQIEQFMAYCTTRAAQQTQILTLCSNLLQKKIIVNCYDVGHKFQQELFLQTAGQLSAYKLKTENYFLMIKKLIDNCVDSWVYSDAKFCPIYGPFIGYLIQQYIDNNHLQQTKLQQFRKINYRLAQKCWKQFQRGKLQLQQNPSLNIQWDQRFFIVSTLCCFRQARFTEFDSEEMQFLTKLIFELRIAKIFSDRQQKSATKRSFHIQRAFSIQKVIFSNIQALSNFLVSNTHLLNDILKGIDNAFPKSIDWQRVGVYEFKGTSKLVKDAYQIDLYRGSMYKNGKQLAALDEKIRQSIKFRQVFGSNRDFQVFPSTQANFTRTKNDFCHHFKADHLKYSIFFEFSEDGKIIRYITKRKDAQRLDQEEIWQLISMQTIKNSKVHIPALFLQDYLPWYCQQKQCIIFRKAKYENIYDIGLIIHLDENSVNDFKVKKALHIVFHSGFQNQNLDQICSIDNRVYEQLILRGKNTKLLDIKPFQLLQKLDKPKFIFQLKNQKTNQIFYLLYRYQLRFKLNQGRLASQSHFGYYVDVACKNTQGNIYQQNIPCLILKKDISNQMILNSHKRILIVSNGQVLQGGEIKKPAQANKFIKSFKYQIHDFFGDIRGLTREAQFQMVALLLSVEDNLKIQGIQMTPLEYAIHIFKTCFTNRPLTNQEEEKLQNIINLSHSESVQSFEMLLLCEILWKGSQLLSSILPFQLNSRNKFLKNKIQELTNGLLFSRTLYQKNIQNQRVSFRKMIQKDMLKFIGVIIRQTIHAPQREEEQSDNEDIQVNQIWTGLKEEIGQYVQSKQKYISESYKQVCDKFETFTIKSDSKNEEEHNQRLKFPQNIQKNLNSESQMMKEMINQLKVSHESFAKQEIRLQRIAKQFQGKKKKQKIKSAEQLKQAAINCIQLIEEVFEKLKQDSQQHPDIISGFRPTLSYTFFTKMLCYQNQIYHYFPKMKNSAVSALKQFIKIWMDLQTRKASFERIIILLKSENVDVVALLRQIQSPRAQICKYKQWVCFQAQMKIQIWPSQLQTYNNLMNPAQNSFCQLNMGEGKTQVIIPMMILKTIYSSQNKIPRINLLSSLYQEARGNLFRFLSVTGFQIPGFQIPFNRKVSLETKRIFIIRDLMNCFSKKAFILVKRESRLSQILRYNEVAIINKNKKAQPLFKQNIFDIFDQIDALMTPKKSYIFSIGKQCELPSSKIRFQMLKQLIQKMLFNCSDLFKFSMIASDETQERTYELIKKGEYPDGLRLTLQNADSKKILQWKRKLALAILQDKENYYYSFIQKLNNEQFDKLVEYCINPHAGFEILSNKISSASLDQIYILRGALAFGIFEHCLSKRCGVDYGIPGQHKKRIAVPYEAADIPSKTSQFQHPEVSIVLSYITYYTKGFSQKEFQRCLLTLKNLTPTSQETQYAKWVRIFSAQQRNSLKIDLAQKININSKTDKLMLYRTFKKNRKAIAFYLVNCIFPKDLKQYNHNICSSSFDLADVKSSIGFSGTMDNHWILPNTIKLRPCQTPSIRGTDGKMIHLVTKFTKQVNLILQDDQRPLWQRYINLALIKKAGCLLDVGALCVGKSLRNQIVPWIAKNQNFDLQKYAGISFCDEDGKWLVYDIETQFYVNRGTTIPDHQTFVLFDEARTRGADLKMNSDVLAALSLGPNLTKDKLMQAAGRLRKLGRNQTLIIMTTHEVLSTLPGFPKQIPLIDKKLTEIKTQELVQLIIAWSCHNTVQDNQHMLSQYSSLGWKYVHSKIRKETFQQNITCQLQKKYKNSLQIKTVSEIGKILAQTMKKQKKQQQLKCQTGKHILQMLQKYGKNVKKATGALDDICERQIEVEKQVEKQIESLQFPGMKAIQQKENPESIRELKGMPYEFPKNFIMTSNFIKTTELKNKNQLLKNRNQPLSTELQQYQLPEGYFVKYNSENLVMISLREASEFIKKTILSENPQKTNYQLCLLNQLSIFDKSIKNYELQQALVCAKFIAGYQNFNEKGEQDILTKFLLAGLKKHFKTLEERRKEYEKAASTILRMKKLYFKKFIGSSLQRVVIRLCNFDGQEDNKPLTSADKTKQQVSTNPTKK